MPEQVSAENDDREWDTPPQATTHHHPQRRTDFVPSQRRSPSRLRDSDPSTPALRANPCPEVTDPFCRLPLPTLFYRPEAVHLGDRLRIWVRHSARFQHASLGFSRADDGTRDSARAAELCGINAVAPFLGANPFQAACVLTKKRELFPGPAAASLRSHALPHMGVETTPVVSTAVLRNIDRIPFRSFRGRIFFRKKSRLSERRSPMT